MPVLYTALYMAAVRTQIYLTHEQRLALDRMTEREGRPLAALIREAVDEFLDRDAPDVEAGLDRTFGALPKFTAPSRDEWSRREDRIRDERPAARQ